MTAVHFTASWIRSRGRKVVAFALFALVLLAALALASSSKASVESPVPPQVWSDKGDYAPGETVQLSGANWAPGESVHIRVNDDAGQTWSRDVDVTADETGAISDQFNLPDWFVATYTVTATGATSGTATWTFTDGNVRVQSRPSLAGNNPKFTLNWAVQGGMNCAGTPSSSGSELNVGSSNGTQYSKGVGNTESIKLTAVSPATSDPSRVFRFWTTDQTTPPTPASHWITNLGGDRFTICVNGFSGNGSRFYFANFEGAPTVVAPPAGQSSSEGSTQAFNLGSFTEPVGVNDAPYTVTVDWGDGSPNTTFTKTTASRPNNEPLGTQNHTYPDGPATRTVTVTVTGNGNGLGGASGSSTFTVSVTNVAPTATLANNGPVDEGSAATSSFSAQSDPSSADSAAGFHYAYSCDGSAFSPAPTYVGTAGSTASTSCSFNDDGSQTVRARIIDKDDGFTEYTTTVTVANVAPTADFSNDGPVNEGSSFTLSMDNGDDASSVDKAAKFTFAFDCGDGSGYGAFSSPAALSAAANCSTNENGSRTVKGKIKDKDGGVREYSGSVTVTNIAPAVTLTGAASANEGGSESYSYSWNDPGSADTFPALGNSVDCGVHGSSSDETFDPDAQTGSFKCTWSDDSGLATADVSATVTDDDGGADTDTINVSVANVAPSATFNAASSVNEGSDIDLLLSDVVDPGTADAFEYRFKCAEGSWSAYGASASHACPTDDNGLVTVKGQLRDDDGGESDIYSANVTVRNVAPAVTLTGAASANEGGSESYSYSWNDPGSADTFPALGNSVDCGVHGSSSDETFDPDAQTGSFKCTWSDDSGLATADVSATVTDDDGGADTDTINVSVANVAPSVELTGDTTVDEGSSHTYTFTVSDPGADTFTIADMYPKCGDNGESVAGSLSVSSSGGSFGCRFPDGPATTDVAIKVADSDGASTTDSEKVVVVTVANVSPAVTAPANQGSDEGENHSFVLGSFTDPGADTWTVDVDWGDGTPHDNSAVGSAGTIPATQHEYDDNGTYTVTVEVADDGGAYDTETFQVWVANLSPTGAFGNNGPINEGGSATVSFTAVSDPSTADSVTLRYAFDCAGGSLAGVDYDDAGTATSTSCSYDDGLSYYSVSGVIIDKDGGRHDAGTVVRVNNVAPSATFSNDGPVNEGSSFTLSLTGPTDPSSADMTAGFQYRFDCGDGYVAYGSSNTATCPTNDNGTRSVKGQIKDKDGGEREYTGSVTVNNVGPIITNVTASDTFAGPLVFMTSSISTFFTDPGSADTWTNLLNFSDGGTENGTSPTAQGGDAYKFTLTHTFATPGCKTVMSKVTDDDGGNHTFGPTPVNVGSGQFLPPVTNTPVTNKLKNGQVLPVKIKLTDCTGAPITNLSPAIVLKKGDMTVFNDDSVVAITPGSVSGADTTGVMRSSGDGSYIYNMSVNITLNIDYTILIYPYGTGTPTQYLAHVIQATK